MYRRWLAVVGVVAGFVCAGCGGKPTTYRLYEGPERPLTEVAVIRDSEWVQILAIDEKPVGSKPYGMFPGDPRSEIVRFPNDAFHLLPGRHSITVRVHRINKTANWIDQSRGINAWTIEHDFDAAETYTLDIQRNVIRFFLSGFRDTQGVPVLSQVQPGGGTELAARPLVEPRPTAPPSPGEGAVIVGQAALEEIHGTGTTIRLVLDTVATRQAIRSAASPKAKGKTLPTPIRTAFGYGVGFFEFRNVPPGDYLVLWRADDGTLSATPITVSPRARMIEGIRAYDLAADLPESREKDKEPLFIRAEPSDGAMGAVAALGE